MERSRRAAVIDRYGDPAELRERSVELAAPGPGERYRCACTPPRSTLSISAPARAGSSVGMSRQAYTQVGTYTEHIVLNAGQVIRVPDKVDLETAATSHWPD